MSTDRCADICPRCGMLMEIGDHKLQESCIRVLKGSLLAERAAHQETQAKLAATLAHFNNAFDLQMQSMLAVVERDFTMKQDVRSLKTQLAETQAKLAGAHENADALLVRLGGDPEGMSDAEVWHASVKAIAETQALARELLGHVEREKLYRETVPVIIRDKHYAIISLERKLQREALNAESDELCAKAKGVLPQALTQA